MVGLSLLEGSAQALTRLWVNLPTRGCPGLGGRVLFVQLRRLTYQASLPRSDATVGQGLSLSIQHDQFCRGAEMSFFTCKRA